MKKLLSILSISSVGVLGFTPIMAMTQNVQENPIDISVGNFHSKTLDLGYHVESLKTYKQNIVPAKAANRLNELGYKVENKWFQFKEGVWLEEDKELSDKLIQGDYGAGVYHLKVIIQPTELGKQNGLVGEMTMYETLVFNVGDLAKYDNSRFDGSYLEKPNFFELYLGFINNTLFSPKNAFYFMYGNYNITWKVSDFFNEKNDHKITQEEWASIKNGPNSVYAYIYPTEKGKELGIINSAKIIFNYIKI